jgi:hypothetical protein
MVESAVVAGRTPIEMIAYIDPGSGSYFFQLVVGGLLGAAVAVKLLWRRIWAFLTGRRSRARDAKGPESDPLPRSNDPAPAGRTAHREG